MVNFATANGSATAGSDYLATNGIVTLAPNETNRTFAVAVFGDLLNEADETFFVNLSNPTNAVIADNQGVGAISNDDPLPDLSISDVTVTEGNSGITQALFLLNLSAPSGRSLTVNFATANNSATAGSDYVATNGILTITAGTTNRTIAVAVLGDVLNEIDESFFSTSPIPRMWRSWTARGWARSAMMILCLDSRSAMSRWPKVRAERPMRCSV
jgi:hypothetical protein